MERGRFCYFGRKQLPFLYEYGKKHYNTYRKPRAAFFGRFGIYNAEFEKKYSIIKRGALEQAFKRKPKELSQEHKKLYALKVIKNAKESGLEIDNKQLSKLLGVSCRSIQRYIHEIPEKEGKDKTTLYYNTLSKDEILDDTNQSSY